MISEDGAPQLNRTINAGGRRVGEPRAHAFDDLPAPGRPIEHMDITDLSQVMLTITVELGSSTMLVRDILELQRGSVITLNKLAGEMTDIYVNGLPLAKGEVVVIGDALHVRIGDILGAESIAGEPGEDEDEPADGH